MKWSIAGGALLAGASLLLACQRPADSPEAPLSLPAARAFAPTPADSLGHLPPGTGVPVGGKPAGFEVRASDGARVSLGELLGRAPLLVVFYRGGWCPYCNFQIRELAGAYPKFEALGVLPVAISVDEIEGASLAERTYEIPFPVLSDPDLAAHRAFGVVTRPSDAYLAKLEAFGIDLEAWSKRTHKSFAVPSIFLLDREGVVRWAHADPDYKTRPTADQLLDMIGRWRDGSGKAG